MENLGPLNFLRIPLSNLWDAPDIRQRIEQADVEFGPRMLRWYCRYEPETRRAIRTQLEWAVQHPTYDFKRILLGVKTSNEDILFYFEFLLRLIAQEKCAAEEPKTAE
jgi:hypothetical protein